MSLHKLTAGFGYDYLTRQVAALDATDKGRTGLASYYAERGESPGVWVGSGMEEIDGLDVGDPVTAEQMRALFGCGLHALAEFIGDSVTDIQVSRATGIRSIGFAKTPPRGRKLAAAGADAITDSVSLLAGLVRRSGRAWHPPALSIPALLSQGAA